MAFPVYNSKEVKVAWGGIPLEGFAEDSFITITPNNDLTSEGGGADGQNQISILPGRSGICTISLQQGSISNALLGSAVNLLQVSGKLISATLTVTDPAGSVLAFLRNAHIKSVPEITLSSDASGQTRDWGFYVEEVYYASTPAGLATAIAASDIDLVAGGIDTLKGFTL